MCCNGAPFAWHRNFACGARLFAPCSLHAPVACRGGGDAPMGSNPRRRQLGPCQTKDMQAPARRLPTTTSPPAPPASVRFRTASGSAAVALCRSDACQSCIPGPRAARCLGSPYLAAGAPIHRGRARHRAPPADTGVRLPAALPLQPAGTDAERRVPRRCARMIRAMTGAAEPAASGGLPATKHVIPVLRSGSPPSPDPRPAPRNRGRAAYRSSGPNDETYADRCNPRGRNPRGGAGR